MKAGYLFTLVLLLFGCAYRCTGQTSVGLLVAPEATLGNWRPLIGLVVEHHKTRRSGFETGLQYRSLQLQMNLLVFVGGQQYNYTATINEHHFTIPLLYKLHSRVVNLAVGPTIDFYMGYASRVSNKDVTVDDYNRNPTLGLGGLLKLGKTINLSDKMVLEPEMRVNPIFNAGNTYVGFGVAGKYRLGK